MKSCGKVYNNYNLLYKVGAGSFATVWFAEHLQLHKNVAIKIIKKKNVTSDYSMNRITAEIENHKKCAHPNIVRFFEVFENESAINIVMEIINNGSLTDYVCNSSIPDEQAKKFLQQLLSAVHYLHELSIIHRDIKPENILIDENYNLKLIDLGLSKIYDPANLVMHTACGSPAFTAPEIIARKPYAEPADVYSIGVVLYYMVTGDLPFSSENISKLFYMVLSNQIVFPSTLSEDLVDLICKMMTSNPNERITIPEIFQHQWMKGYHLINGINQNNYINNNNNNNKNNSNCRNTNNDFSCFPKREIIVQIVNSFPSGCCNEVDVIRCVKNRDFSAYDGMYRILENFDQKELMKDMMTESVSAEINAQKGLSLDGENWEKVEKAITVMLLEKGPKRPLLAAPVKIQISLSNKVNFRKHKENSLWNCGPMINQPRRKTMLPPLKKISNI